MLLIAHCEEVSSLSEAVRLQKAVVEDHNNGICTLKKSSGDYIGSSKATGRPEMSSSRCHSLAKKIVCVERVQWPVTIFGQYKLPGPDQVRPCLLQHGSKVLVPQFVRPYKISRFLTGMYPIAATRPKWTLYRKRGTKISSFQKHIDLC